MDRFTSVKKASILGIIGNIFLLTIKIFVGIISNSPCACFATGYSQRDCQNTSYQRK